MQFKKLSSVAFLPERAHPGDSGLDLRALGQYELPPNVPVHISTGIACAFPPGHEGQIRPRSSLSRAGIHICFGTIDNGYRGDLGVIAINLNTTWRTVNFGDKIAQLVVVPIATPEVEEVTEFDNTTSRGDKGWGSTGA